MKKNVFEARKQIIDKILMIINKKIEDGVNEEKLDLLDALLMERQKEGNKDFDDNAVVAESLSFLFAGSETTSSTLSIVLYTLAMYPEIQEKLFQEIRGSVGEGPVSFEHINKIQYLEWVVNEVMRMHPTAPLMSRVLDRDIQLGDRFVPKDTVVLVDVKQLHNDPLYWENPQDFIPERFADYDKTSKSFMPFGAGKRVCVGKTLAMTEIQAVLMNLILNFKFEKTEGLAWPIQTDFKFTTQPKAFNLNVVRRN
jgi:cytochrome P450